MYCNPTTDCTGASDVGGNHIAGALMCTGNPNGIFNDVNSNVVGGATTDQCKNEGSQK